MLGSRTSVAISLPRWSSATSVRPPRRTPIGIRVMQVIGGLVGPRDGFRGEQLGDGLGHCLLSGKVLPAADEDPLECL